MNYAPRCLSIYLLIIISILQVNSLFGQSNKYFSYQAVISNAEGQPVEGSIGVKISILQYSADGETIYSERQTKDSDKNGFLSLSVGDAEVIYTGKFDLIDWSDGPYFMKTEISPTGGYVYSLSSISEVLSVPIAMHALKADSVSVDFQETDPIFEASVASKINEADTIRWNSLSKKARFAIGDIYKGGIIFYVEPAGDHGLIANLMDISDQVWGSVSTLTNTNSYYDGFSNTNKIVFDTGAGSYAAYTCDTLNTENYDDWYLPAVDEMLLLFKARFIINKILENDDDPSSMPMIKDSYWTSTERDADDAFLIETGNSKISDKNNTATVRAIRSF